MATAINDFVQGCIMLVGICAVVGAILNTQGGFSEALHNPSRCLGFHHHQRRRSRYLRLLLRTRTRQFARRRIAH